MGDPVFILPRDRRVPRGYAATDINTSHQSEMLSLLKRVFKDVHFAPEDRNRNC